MLQVDVNKIYQCIDCLVRYKYFSSITFHTTFNVIEIMLLEFSVIFIC